MPHSSLLSGSCHLSTVKTYTSWLPNSFSPEPIIFFSFLVIQTRWGTQGLLCLCPSLTEQILVSHLSWSFLHWKVTSSAYFVFYPVIHARVTASSLLQHLCTDNHSVLSTPAHSLRHRRAHHQRAIPVMWVTSPSGPTTDMLPSASLLNCAHLRAPSSVTLWPSHMPGHSEEGLVSPSHQFPWHRHKA